MDEKSIVRNALGKGEPTQGQQAIVLQFTQRRRGNRSIYLKKMLHLPEQLERAKDYKNARDVMLCAFCPPARLSGLEVDPGSRPKDADFTRTGRGKVSFDKARMYDSQPMLASLGKSVFFQ